MRYKIQLSAFEPTPLLLELTTVFSLVYLIVVFDVKYNFTQFNQHQTIK